MMKRTFILLFIFLFSFQPIQAEMETRPKSNLECSKSLLFGKSKTVIFPVDGWVKDGNKIWLHKEFTMMHLLPNRKLIVEFLDSEDKQKIRYDCNLTPQQVLAVAADKNTTAQSASTASSPSDAASAAKLRARWQKVSDAGVCKKATIQIRSGNKEIIKWVGTSPFEDVNYTEIPEGEKHTQWAKFEVRRRGLSCDVSKELPSQSVTKPLSGGLNSSLKLADMIDSEICKYATFNGEWNNIPSAREYREEAKRRGLSCGLQTIVALRSDEFICERAVSYDLGKLWSDDPDLQDFVIEAKRRGLNCENSEVISTTQTASATAPTSNSVSNAELTAAQKEAERLRQELAALKAEQQQEQRRIDSDTQIPLITASSRRDNETNALIVGKVTDDVEVAEVTINGEPVRLSSSGSFETSFYVPRSGKTIEIVAFDSKGNKATKSIKLERGAIQQATGPVFANLNPSGKRVSQNKDALALIIGVADYQRTSAKAAYADKDAQTFYDYAMLKLGIPAGNIKELVNQSASRVDISLAVKDWIARTAKQGKSDVYVFFAGHGLADQTGKEMYLLPADGEPRLLSDSSISRNELFSDIAAANPRSVTVFLDTCYSGTTRGTDMLVASRPIAIRAKQQNIPDGFTVFTAAGGDQTAKPLEEAKHGMFSYFLMKGMEGDADSNNDNQITAAELHEYVEQNVVQQSGGSQVPELQGDAGRVLVRFQ